jgi:hypothetical protein
LPQAAGAVVDDEQFAFVVDTEADWHEGAIPQSR